MKQLFFVFTLFLFVALVALGIFISGSSPVDITGTQKKVFIVNQGDGVNSIANRLQDNGLIKNKYIFIIHAYILGLTQKLQAGSFELSPSLSTSALATQLSKGGRLDVWIKIIDGQRNEEINQSLFDHKEFLIAAKSKQGYLYPDSYSIPKTATLDQLFSIINANFTSKLSQIKANSNPELNDHELLILASLIEREARTLSSKQYVAGILLNRLKIGMALQVDATVQYARDSKFPAPKNYWSLLAKKDLTIISPYNTYLIPRLPPTPICNPGYDSLYAAYHPIDSDYLFYITGNDNKMHYATTLDQHNTNIAKYLR